MSASQAGGWSLSSLFADLEQQASGAAQVERDAEVEALGAVAYAEVDLASRLHGAVAGGAEDEFVVRLLCGDQFSGRPVRIGADFLVLETGAGVQWAIAVGAVAAVTGLGEGALIAEARPLRARLGLRSLLRELADQGSEVGLVLADGARRSGRILRVGADFAEFDDGSGAVVVVRLAGLAALCLR